MVNKDSSLYGFCGQVVGFGIGDDVEEVLLMNTNDEESIFRVGVSDVTRNVDLLLQIEVSNNLSDVEQKIMERYSRNIRNNSFKHRIKKIYHNWSSIFRRKIHKIEVKKLSLAELLEEFAKTIINNYEKDCKCVFDRSAGIIDKSDIRKDDIVYIRDINSPYFDQIALVLGAVMLSDDTDELQVLLLDKYEKVILDVYRDQVIRELYLEINFEPQFFINREAKHILEEIGVNVKKCSNTEIRWLEKQLSDIMANIIERMENSLV